MGFEYMRTVHGILSIVQILLGGAVLFIGYFVWTGGDVYFLFVKSGWPLVTFVLFATFACWAVSLSVTIIQIFSRDILEELGKLKVLIFHGLCAALMLVSAAMESRYVAVGTSELLPGYYPRLVIDMILLWILLLTYLGQIAFVLFFQ